MRIRLRLVSDAKMYELEGDFTDQHDFWFRLSGLIGFPAEMSLIDETYYEMIACGIKSPKVVQDKILTVDYRKRAQQLIREFNGYSGEQDLAARMEVDE